MTILEQLYRKVAKQLEVPVEVVEKAWRFQVLYTKEQMEGPEFQTVRWPRICSFKPMDGRLRKLEEKLEKQAQQESEA